MKKERFLLNGESILEKVVKFLISRGQYFEVDPMSNNLYELAVKEENQKVVQNFINQPSSDVKKKSIVCSHCGSSNVQKDALAEWSNKNQCWNLSTTYEKAYCDDCDGEANLKEIPFSPSDNPNNYPVFEFEHEDFIGDGSKDGLIKWVAAEDAFIATRLCQDIFGNKYTVSQEIKENRGLGTDDGVDIVQGA